MATSRPSEFATKTQPSKTRSPLPPRSSDAPRLSVAKPLAPEDVRPGDYVAVLDELYELPSFWWPLDTALHPRDELVRLRLLPTQENPPLKVKSVCLPFVLAKPPTGGCRVLDLRRLRLARLDGSYGRAVWKNCKKNRGDSSAAKK